MPVTKARGRLGDRGRRPGARASRCRPGPASPTCGTRGQKTQRPKSTRAAGSTSSAKVAATTTPIAQARPRPRVVGTTESSRVSRPSTTVVALESTASAVRRTATRHRLVARLVRLELVAVAGDQEQGVVGAGAEDEHATGCRRSTRPRRRRRRPGLGGEDGGEPVGDADDGERDQPEHRAAVGDDQQQRDHAGGGEQQVGVGAVEDRGQVGLDGGRAGDLAVDAVGGVVASCVAQLGDLVGVVGGRGRTRRARRRWRAVPSSATTGPVGALAAPTRPRVSSPAACSAIAAPASSVELAPRAVHEHDRRPGPRLGELLAQLGAQRAVGALGQGVQAVGLALALAERRSAASARRRGTRATSHAVRRPAIDAGGCGWLVDGHGGSLRIEIG